MDVLHQTGARIPFRFLYPFTPPTLVAQSPMPGSTHHSATEHSSFESSAPASNCTFVHMPLSSHISCLVTFFFVIGACLNALATM